MFNQYKDITLVIVGALLVSTKGILLKFLYAEGVTVEASLLLRSCISVPMIWFWACYKSSFSALLKTPRHLVAGAMLAGVVSYYIAAWLDFVALTMIDAGLERVLLFSYPILVVIARSIIVRQLPSWRVVVAVALIYTGIVLAVGGLDMNLWQQNRVGAFLVLLSACGFTYYLFANERYARQAGSASFIVWAISAASIALLIHFMMFNDPQELKISTKAWGYLLLMTAFTSVLPLFLFSEGIRRIGTQRAALLSTIGPPAAIFLAAYLLGETMSWIQIVGAGLIIVGIVVVEYRTKAAGPTG